MNKNASIFSIPWAVSAVITYILIDSIILTTPRYGIRSCLFSGLVFAIWTVTFAVHQRRCKRNKYGLYIKSNFIIVITLGVIMGIFLAYMVWGSGYASLAPFEKIDNGTQFIDTLFHSSIAESWRRSLFPSTLLNDERYIAYHSFSHLILGLFAGALRIPSFIAYNYIYPVIFLPLYCFSILLAVSFAKRYFEHSLNISFLDIVIIGLFLFGVSDNIGEYGVWKMSYYVSESFLVANTFSFLGYALIFYFLYRNETNKQKGWLLYLFVIPAEILLISWSKISVGFIFTACIMYVVFRIYLKSVRMWIMNIIYFLEFLACLWFFDMRGGVSNAIASGFSWFPYARDYISGDLGMAGHYLVLSLMSLLFIGLEINKNRFSWKDIREGKSIWVEVIIVASILAFFPASFVDMASASAYFSFAIEIPALVLLCGHNYIDVETDAKGALKPVIIVCCFLFCTWMGLHNKPENPLIFISNDHNSNLSNTLLEIRDKVDGHPKDYTIFLDNDCFLSKVFSDSMTAIFVPPAITGVGVINATYLDNGLYYTFSGAEALNYNTGAVENGCLSYEDALQLAKQRGKKGLIHFTDTGYEIVRLN